MKPPQGIRNYRKKIRPFRRKCRNPSSEIKLNQFIIKIEINAAQGKPLRKPYRPKIDSNLRFGRCQAQLERLRKLRDRVHVPIQAWKAGRTDLRDLVKGPASPYLPPGPPRVKTETGGMKIKSELKMVTETCTATVTSVTASPRASTKVSHFSLSLDFPLNSLYSPGQGGDPSGDCGDPTGAGADAAHHSHRGESEAGAAGWSQDGQHGHHVSRDG